MELGEPLGEYQAQTGAVMTSLGTRIQLLKLKEQLRQIRGADADAGVPNSQPQRIAIAFHAKTHRAPGLGELQGVRKQVVESLHEAVTVQCHGGDFIAHLAMQRYRL